jgi:hypothetical protein
MCADDPDAGTPVWELDARAGLVIPETAQLCFFGIVSRLRMSGRVNRAGRIHHRKLVLCATRKSDE